MNDREELFEDLQAPDAKNLSSKWDDKFLKFLEDGSNKDATFALHKDIINHLSEFVAIAFAERIGDEDDYNILRV